MTIARRQQVDLAITPYYHCVSRCVRRSFLCGRDPLTSRSYEHRRAWLEKRIHKLATIYCIDICAYAVMSNHYHLVVHINKDKALALSDKEVIERWSQEHKIDPFIAQFENLQQPNHLALEQYHKLIEKWRERLYSLSWMMKELNMSIAFLANKEDECTGHFWEGRYKSQALLDEKALLAAMTYVDLNPMRARIVETPEDADHTSLKLRINALKQNQATPEVLYPFVGVQKNVQGLPFRLKDYLEWVDWMGKQTAFQSAEQASPRILERLGIDDSHFVSTCTQIEKRGCLWIGTQSTLHTAKVSLNKQRIQGVIV